MSRNNIPGTFKYQNKAGDTLFNLAKKHNASLNNMLSINPGIDSNNLKVGQTINIPLNNPAAVASVKGSPLRPQIEGTVRFFDVPDG